MEHREHPRSCVVLAERSRGAEGKLGSFRCQIFISVTFATLCGTSHVPAATSGNGAVASAQFPSQGPSGQPVASYLHRNNRRRTLMRFLIQTALKQPVSREPDKQQQIH